MNIPQGYKQTELGIIPEDWEVTTIKQIADITTGNKNTQDAEEGGKYPFYVRSQNVERINSYSYDCEGIVTAGDGVGTGKIFHYVRGKFGLHQRAYLIYNFKDFDSQYFYWYFSQYFYDRINQMTAKSSVDSVRKEMIEDMCILRAPIAEQRAIAEALSDVDGLIAALDKKIAKKRLLKQGAMQQLLTGKKRLPGFTDEWGKMCFKSIYKFASEGGTPDTKNESFYANGNIPFVKIEDTEQKYIYSGKSFITQEGVNHSSAWLIPTNSIIFTNGATIGNVAINKIPVTTKQGILGIILNSRVELEFIYYLLSSSTFQDEVNMRLSKGTFATIILKHLDEIPINIPVSLKEQQAIATILSDMDKEIADLEAQRDKYRLLKSGMMQKLLTGQIKLK